MTAHKKKLVVLSGAGMSAESGLSTFRDAGGLWEGYDVMDVASPEGWRRNMDLVLDFYNERRRQLIKARPNAAHEALMRLEKHYDVTIVTQNVDDLHERAGSQRVFHLHGELLKVRSTRFGNLVYPWTTDLKRGDVCERGAQLRPHIVWFGEQVPMMDPAIQHIHEADIVLIIGTSMQVYPAAGLIRFAPESCEVFYIDPRPQVNAELSFHRRLKIFREKAGTGVPKLVDDLLKSEIHSSTQ